jgi:hypothetical protein
MTKSGILAVTVLLAASGAAAADSKEDPQSGEKTICRTEPVTGSRTRVRRICMTESQWRELAARTAQNVDRYSNLQTSRRDPEQTRAGLPGEGGN